MKNDAQVLKDLEAAFWEARKRGLVAGYYYEQSEVVETLDRLDYKISGASGTKGGVLRDLMETITNEIQLNMAPTIEQLCEYAGNFCIKKEGK